MQWVLPSRPARRPSAGRDARRSTQVIGVHQAGEGKVGENPPHLYRGFEKGKSTKKYFAGRGLPLAFH
jgi:hypothetical protein